MNAAQRLVVAAMVGALAIGGVGLLIVAFRPPPPRRVSRTIGRGRSTVSTATGLAALGAGLLVIVLTRWVAAAVATAVLVLVWSSLFQSVAATNERRRIDAIAKWLEDLRDLQRGSNLDLSQALDRSALRAPKEIADELARFTERIRHHAPFDEALLALASDLDHPTSDMAIAALLFAHGHASGSVLYDTFEELAATARDELKARDQIDRLRARFESSMRRMLAILAALVAYLLIASGDTLDEYRTPAGQVFLIVPIAIWASALWWLRRLSRYERLGRYLDYDAVSASAAGAAP